ncbi:MAG: type II toxin-antitoxin system RelE/ParE family toxin [Proteobacteria bacterium]|nr:type II toxin-antitoxin system RelE/ParE family toxin [Pseudomonadota bacterium]
MARLPAFLEFKSASAASRARHVLIAALETLAQFPLRGRMVRAGLWELVAPFGRDAFLLRYRVSDSEVFVTRIRHSREAR